MSSTSSDNIPTKIFTKQISVDDYNNQKEDYTQKALRELNEQMKTFKRPETKTNDTLFKKINSKDNKRKISENEEDSDNYELEEDFDEEEFDNKIENDCNNSSVNLIIKHVLDKKSSKIKNNNAKSSNAKSSNKLQINSMDDNIINSIYAQHEIDINTIAQLNKTILELKQNIKDKKKDFDDVDNKMHYLKLDLCNLQCDNKDFIKEITSLKNEIQIQNNKIILFEKNIKNRQFYIKILKVSVMILLLLNIWIENFEFLLLIIGFVVCYF
jgi:hypothetical protein